MDRDTRFLDLIRAHGGKPGAPSRALLAWLRSHALSEDAISVVSGIVLKEGAGIGALRFSSEADIPQVNGDEFVPIAIRDGLLIVGGCPNGDLVAVDVREQLGTVGYIDHETMWHTKSVREVFLPLAASLGELAGALAAGDAPWDYYAALERQRGQSDSK